MWRAGVARVCECEKVFFRETAFKREKGAVICVRELQNNAGGRQETVKVSQLVMCATPACLSVCLFV